MRQKGYTWSDGLARLYNEIRGEICFDLARQSLLPNRDESTVQQPCPVLKNRAGRGTITRQCSNSRRASRSPQQRNKKSSETSRYRFIRRGTDIEVAVDYISETNFFADISNDLENCGLFIATYDILKVGTRLKVRLVLPRGRSFRLLGTVAWIREPDNCTEGVSPGMGISFLMLSNEPLSAIRSYMSKRPPLLYEVA